MLGAKDIAKFDIKCLSCADFCELPILEGSNRRKQVAKPQLESAKCWTAFATGVSFDQHLSKTVASFSKDWISGSL